MKTQSTSLLSIAPLKVALLLLSFTSSKQFFLLKLELCRRLNNYLIYWNQCEEKGLRNQSSTFHHICVLVAIPERHLSTRISLDCMILKELTLISISLTSSQSSEKSHTTSRKKTSIKKMSRNHTVDMKLTIYSKNLIRFNSIRRQIYQTKRKIRKKHLRTTIKMALASLKNSLMR